MSIERCFLYVVMLPSALSISLMGVPEQRSHVRSDPVGFVGSEEVVPWLSGTQNAEGDAPMGVDVICDGRSVTFPSEGILVKRFEKRILICPSEKAGSSTIRRFIQTIQTGKFGSPQESAEYSNQHEVHTLLNNGQHHDLCNVDFATAVVRNPYDRLRSGYSDKINRVTHVPGKPNATFGEFVAALKDVHPRRMNVHWMPISTHCVTSGPNKYPYSKIYKIENELETMFIEAFAHLGFSKANVRHVLDRIGVVNVNSDDSHDLEARKDFYQQNGAGCKNAVRKMYADDFALGNYSFDKFP